jgi:hypothetical protein
VFVSAPTTPSESSFSELSEADLDGIHELDDPALEQPAQQPSVEEPASPGLPNDLIRTLYASLLLLPLPNYNEQPTYSQNVHVHQDDFCDCGECGQCGHCEDPACEGCGELPVISPAFGRSPVFGTAKMQESGSYEFGVDLDSGLLELLRGVTEGNQTGGKVDPRMGR